MSALKAMRLQILLPYTVFADQDDVTSLVVETAAGAFGLLPNRLDCAAALLPGILSYVSKTRGERLVALDQGLLVKAGGQVRISVRHAFAGADLLHMRERVEHEFLVLDQHERSARQVVAKVEAGLLRQLAELHNG